jgi:hypothetical protein
MPLPSPQEFLAKLEADPQAAAAFDRATQRDSPGRSRLEAVQACHTLATNTLREIEVNKAKLVIARQKIAALEAARKSQPASFMKTTPPPTKAPIATATATVTAAAFAKPQTAMLRSEWQNLSAKDKSRFFAEGGKLV